MVAGTFVVMIRILSQLRAQSRTFRPAADRRICRLIHSLHDLGHKKTSPRIRPLYARDHTLSFAVAAECAQAAPGPEVEYEAVIGIETHVQLNTSTKAFCSCRNEYGAEPNTQVCAVCLGHPGSLPVLNSDMVRLGVLAGVGLGTRVATASNFDRKQYFYPDLPKGYQISQYGEPLCEAGAIEFPMPDGSGTKRVGITRAHLEEDAGKLTHLGADALAGSAGSNVDFNRAGVPLLEIVSEPDLRTGQEAAAYGQEIRRIMRYLGVSNGNMAEGSLRCDVNVSVRPKGSETLGTKVEVKNMNSFSAMQKAIDFEISRQVSLIKEGRADEVMQETRLFDEGRQETYTMRKKEGLADYRYFPEPDLPPLLLSQEYLDSVESSMPELPGQKRTRYLEMGLKLKEVLAITDEATTAEYFDAVVAAGAAPKLANNWVMGDIVAHCKEAKISMSELAMSPSAVAEMIALIEDGTISGKIAKEVLPDLLQGKGNSGVKAFCQSQGMVQISDPDAIGAIIDAVLESNPKQLEQFRGGKTKLQGFFVGQVMKESGGRVNPAVMNKLLAQKLQG